MMRKDYFVFGSVSSRDYDIWLTGARTEDTPERDVTLHTIPGRNGELITDNKRWKNVKVEYSAAILSGFMAHFDGMKKRMLSQTGYQRLEDTIRPDEYRMAMLRSPISPKTTRYNRAGQFDLVFECKPQRFLKSGDSIVSFDAPGALANLTDFVALPLITVYGSAAGTVTVGNVTVEIKSILDKVTLDCDLQDAYRLTDDGEPENHNSNIYAPAFPQLLPGENAVSWTGGIERVEITPRWWSL